MTEQVLSFPWISSAVLILGVSGVSLSRSGDPVRARTLAAVLTGLMTVFGAGAAVWLYSQGTGATVTDPFRLAFYSERALFQLDQLNAILFPFSALLALCVLLAAPRREPTTGAAGRTVLLLCSTWMLFASADLGVLALAWGLGQLPVLSERTNRARARTRVPLAYMAASTVFLLIAIGLILVVVTREGVESPTSLLALAGAPSLHVEGAVPFILLAVMVRKGVLPFQSWVPSFAEQRGTMPLILLVTPQVAAFVIVRVVMPLFPEAASEAVPLIGRVALVGTLYGAMLGLTTQDLRRAFGWLVVSQSSLVLVGLEATNAGGFTGALVLWLSVGLSLAGLGLAVTMVEARVGRVDLQRFHGLARNTRLLAAVFLILGLTVVGLPGTLGFVAEDLIVHGTLESYPWMGVAIILATAANAFNVLRWFFRIFCGPRSERCLASDLLLRERAALLPLVFLLFVLGLSPGGLVATRSQVVKQLLTIEAHTSAAVARDGRP